MLTGLGVGFVVGWLLFKRPEFVSKAVAWMRAKVGL
jgi:hypothetical protein